MSDRREQVARAKAVLITCDGQGKVAKEAALDSLVLALLAGEPGDTSDTWEWVEGGLVINGAYYTRGEEGDPRTPDEPTNG